MGVAPTGWNLLGTLFRCREAPPEVSEELAYLLSGFTAEGPPVQRVVDFAILRENGTTELRLGLGNGNGKAPIQLREPFAGWAEYHMVCEALALARDRWALHAAAVIAPGGTCVILGRQDAGKTTLAMFLWAHGMTVLADDVLPIPYASPRPDPFPRAFHTERELIAPLRGRIPPRPHAFPETCYPFPGAPTLSVPPIRYVLALKRGADAGDETIPIQQAEAAHRLVRGTIRTDGFEFDRALKGAREIATDCSAYAIRASTPEGAAQRALEVLSGD